MKRKSILLIAVMLSALLVLSACTTQQVTETADIMDNDDSTHEDDMDMDTEMDKDENSSHSDDMDKDMDEDSSHSDDMDEDMDEDTMDKDDDMMTKNTILLHTLDGEEINIVEGEKIYIKTWASWCSVCLAGLEELDELAASEPDFKVISVVAPDYQGEMSEEEFVEWWAGLDYENIVVLLDREAELLKEVGVRAYPTSVYLDSNGEITQSIIGHNANDMINGVMSTIS